MGRLIDEDVLLNSLNELGWLDDTPLDEIINEQPTAYDVKKVEEQLDEYITKIVGRKSALYQTIMSIVRRGGVE